MSEITVQRHKGHPGCIELVFDNDWKYVYSIRLFIQNLINEFIDDGEKAEMIALAANELVENAVKYNAVVDSSSVHLKLIHNESDRTMTLEIRNISTIENIEILQNELKKKDEVNPRDWYLQKMRELPGRADGKSMLGLARVQYEAGCNLNLHVNDDEVTVTTVFSL